jgi:Tol biopolymer transport system component
MHYSSIYPLRERRWLQFRLVILMLLTGIFTGIDSSAQYFGRNKPGYRKFKFDIAKTPHFEIYHYLKNDSMVNEVSQMAEKWYQMHQKVFRDTFRVQNPIILYSNQADFQQTNTVSEMIGIGTGGVTEALKNRVIIPVAPSLAQTDHVLGHELVHAFQYHLFLNSQVQSKSQGEQSLQNIPLWMIEGMAEYLSKGSVDPHTSMVMRDALLNNDFPSIKKLSTDPKYFPYTYGQAFWAMIAKTWGDDVIIPLLKRTAYVGFEKAADSLLKYNSTTISGMWKSATELYYGKFMKARADSLTGKEIISEENGGRINVSPSLSPDGKYIAFFSEKDLFTLDLFLADASTGKIIKKLSSMVRNNEIDDFNFIESSGTWSPDGKKFAFVVFSKGKNKLAILNVAKGTISKEYEIPGVPSFSNPSWSPDGQRIVMTGLVNGISDLYLFYPSTREVERLTDDFTADLHPSWSSDGKYIVFSKERVNDHPDRKKYSFNIAILDPEKKTSELVDVFNESYNMNPVFSPDDRYIYFLSDADGFRNMFRYERESGRVFRLTEYMTGISGITEFSPALSVSRDKNLVAYNYFLKDRYHIYLADGKDFRPEELDRNYYSQDASVLPPLKNYAPTLIDKRLANDEQLPQLPEDSIKTIPYRPRFKLDYISNGASVGVSTGLYRNNMGGSVNMIFSDMVSNNQIYASLNLNGEIYDFGGQVAYINQTGKLKWGAALSHIPYVTGGMYMKRDTLSSKDGPVPVDNIVLDYIRIFENNISLFAYIPLSQTRRFEGSASSSWYNYRIDRFNNYYSADGIELGGNRRKQPAPPGFSYQQLSVAYVEDNSFSGMTGPMQGHRERFQVERYFGDANIYTTLVDYRKYFFIKPFSLAFRLYNYNLYGNSSQVGLPQLYIGYPWFIRGYGKVFSQNSEGDNNFNVSWLTGSKIAVANAEFRLPLTGPERLAVIKSKWFLSDLNIFFDAGLAWNDESKISIKKEVVPSPVGEDLRRSPVLSTGVSLRINVLGYMVIEPFYAFPFQYGGFRNGQFGVNLVPGW